MNRDPFVFTLSFAFVNELVEIASEIDEHAYVTIGIEEIDEENKFVRYSYNDGLILKNFYKTLSSKIQVASKGEGCIVKWSFEYEKKNEDVPDPKLYIDFLLGVAKDI
ncbi:Kirola [Bienertia sinuspersici]